ncbi:MAG: beta-ketoacyl-[acyl-carrier-protein] synthase family protein [Planctomycetota bacterium]|nr:MAG: beta-ketoacyl-[acyl-carrier-protein] synthase family protein [Planctomycetota bacterium]
MMSMRRVVITGMGVITPLGNSCEELWDGLLAGRSGVAPISTVPVEYLPTKFAAEARDFTGHIDNFGPLEGDKKKAIRKGLKVMCRESQMGVAAAQRALTHAGLGASDALDPERSGVVFGSDYMITAPDDFAAGIQQCIDESGDFDFSRWATEGMPHLTPLWLLKYLPNMPASHVAIFNDMRGPNNSITLREASANAAVGEATRTILRGSAEVMLAGATGTRIHPMKIVHTLTQEEVARNGVEPARASRPFDLNRGGMVLGEGAGVIVLEELQHALDRGATVFGEVLGTASSSVANQSGVAQRETALVNCMKGALRSADRASSSVGHLHAHGLSTRSCDEAEARAIHAVFGDDAARLPVTAAKSYFGNLGAGGGLVELIASVMAMRHNRLFGVLNYETPDPKCELAISRGDDEAGSSFLNVSVTPQGQASAVIVGSVDA